jgi:hypothetical protein
VNKVGARPKYDMYEVLEAARLYPDNVQAAAAHLECTYDTFDRYMMNAGLPIIPRRSKAPIAGYKRIDWNAANVAKLKGLIDKEPRLHAIARDAADERHEHIRDRAAAMFGVTSLTELDMSQMRMLIDVYTQMLKPEPTTPVVMGRGAFAGLPKRVTPTPAPAPPKPAKLQSAQIVREPRWCAPDGSKPDLTVRRRTFKKAHNFDPNLKIERGGVEEIPW